MAMPRILGPSQIGPEALIDPEVIVGHPAKATLLATGGGDWNQPGEVRLWDTSTWRQRARLKHTGEVLCVAISPDGRALAAGENAPRQRSLRDRISRALDRIAGPSFDEW